MPYQDKENEKTTGLPNNRLVKALLEVMQHPQMHEVYFQKQHK